MVLLGILIGASVYAIQSANNNQSYKAAFAQTYVPVPGALVSASGDGGSGGALADSSGNYLISTYLGTGTYSVMASAPGYIDGQTDNVAVTSGAQTANVIVYLSVSGGISGQVTDSVGYAVAKRLGRCLQCNGNG